MADLVLRVDGLDLAGWTSIQVTRDLDQLADTFDLSISTSLLRAARLVEGARCQVLYRGETIINGFIDDVDAGDTATSSTLSVTGRSRAGDLVDCSAFPKTWRNTSGLDIARDLCEPFDIKVEVEGDAQAQLATEGSFKVNDGETVYDVLDRLGRLNGARICSYPDGSIRFTRTGFIELPEVTVARGVNVVSARVHRSMATRYSEYIFKAQRAATDDDYGEAATQVKHVVTDDGCSRYRPLIVRTETQPRNTKGQFVEGEVEVKHPLEMVAIWERNTRAGQSLQLQYEVVNPDDLSRSWEHQLGGIWEPNSLVTVRDERYEIDGLFLVTSVTLVRDERGTRTQLALTWPEARGVKVPPKKKKEKGGYSW